MKEYENIFNAYITIDDYLLRNESGDEEHRDAWAKLRALNDMAYFVMLFAQLEQLINEQVKRLVTRKKGEKEYDRAWDIIETTKNFEDRFPFRDKVTLLVGKGSHVARDIWKYYEIRCGISHGVLVDIPLSIYGFAKRINELAGNLTRQGEEQ